VIHKPHQNQTLVISRKSHHPCWYLPTWIDVHPRVRELSCGQTAHRQTDRHTYTHTYGDYNTCCASIQRRAGNQSVQDICLIVIKPLLILEQFPKCTFQKTVA